MAWRLKNLLFDQCVECNTGHIQFHLNERKRKNDNDHKHVVICANVYFKIGDTHIYTNAHAHSLNKFKFVH